MPPYLPEGLPATPEFDAGCEANHVSAATTRSRRRQYIILNDIDTTPASHASGLFPSKARAWRNYAEDRR